MAQFPNVEAVLVAPLGGNDEGKMVLKDLENEGVMTRYCKIWENSGVPSAWVLHSGMSLHIIEGVNYILIECTESGG